MLYLYHEVQLNLPKSVHWFSFQIWTFIEHKTLQQNIISEFGAYMYILEFDIKKAIT